MINKQYSVRINENFASSGFPGKPSQRIQTKFLPLSDILKLDSRQPNISTLQVTIVEIC